jgi:hypothetical protein
MANVTIAIRLTSDMGRQATGEQVQIRWRPCIDRARQRNGTGTARNDHPHRATSNEAIDMDGHLRPPA